MRLPKTTGEFSMATKTAERANYPKPSPSMIVGSILAMGVIRILEQKEESAQKRVAKLRTQESCQSQSSSHETQKQPTASPSD